MEATSCSILNELRSNAYPLGYVLLVLSVREDGPTDTASRWQRSYPRCKIHLPLFHCVSLQDSERREKTTCDPEIISYSTLPQGACSKVAQGCRSYRQLVSQPHTPFGLCPWSSPILTDPSFSYFEEFDVLLSQNQTVVSMWSPGDND